MKKIEPNVKFELGNVVCTSTIANDIQEIDGFRKSINECITRHWHGDYGDLCQEDIESNEEAIKNGDRILSAYKIEDEKIYIITEADRSYTTVLYAYEY